MRSEYPSGLVLGRGIGRSPVRQSTEKYICFTKITQFLRTNVNFCEKDARFQKGAVICVISYDFLGTPKKSRESWARDFTRVGTERCSGVRKR